MFAIQTLLVLATLTVTVFGGTRVALPGEEQKALALWDRYCAGGKEGGKESNIFIHCKHPLEQLTKSLQSSIQAQTRDGVQKEQYIFVQPPRIHFNHELEIRGGAALEPKTIVYVKPAKTSHTYEADLQIPENEHKKPELVFLSSGSSGGSRGVGVEVAEASSPVATVVENKQTSSSAVVESKQISSPVFVESKLVNKRETEPLLYSRPYSSVVAVTSSRKRRDSW